MQQIQDKEQQWKLAELMFRFNSLAPLSKLDLMQSAKDLLTSGFWTFCIYEYPTINNKYASFYVDKHGEWMHQAGRTTSHNQLGMNWAGRIISIGGDVYLDDSPDISAIINDIRIIGDVGKCSFYPAALFQLRSMQKGDLWISVFDGREIIMEAQDDIFPLLQEPDEYC